MLSNTLRGLLVMAIAVIVPPAAAQVSGPNGPQLNIAHRGASAYAPEHTFFAYDLAIEMDADMLECDVLLSADEVPVCIHDTTVDRTSDASGAVSDYTLAELREMDFGSWFNTRNPTQADDAFVGAKIVPFEEQLDCYLRINPLMRFHVETKDSAGGRAEEVLTELLTRKGLIDTGGGRVADSSVLMQSFDPASLERIKALAPTLPTVYLYGAPTNLRNLSIQTSGTGDAYMDAFSPNNANILADPSVIDRFHANGHDVHTYTVNDRQTMDTLLGYGIDGIFTNNPDILRAAIDELGTGTTPEQRGNPSDFERGCPGVAGRVVSNQGPGDIWAPAPSGRGVVLVQAAGEPPANPDDAPSDAGSAVDSGGGALNLLSLAALIGLLYLGRRGRSRPL